MERLVSLLFVFFVFLCSHADPKHEVRAVWLTTIGGIDWPHSYASTPRSVERQKAELRSILDKLQRANINTVLLQTRIRGTVIYPSAFEPWDGCLSGKPGVSPGYDALRFAVDECHRRGMEIHAWVVTVPVGKWNGAGCSRLRRRFRGLIRKIGPDGYMNPEDSRTASYLSDICAEIVRGYDVDGIHLDYIRYPENWPRIESKSRGRGHITDIVKAISSRVKALKPWVKMSCSPVGKYDDLSRYSSRGWNAYTAVCQDAQGWLRDGLMDELFPMMYFRDEQFYPFAVDWAENSHGRIVAPGLGIYFLSPGERDWPLSDITREMEVLRSNGMGHAYFRSKFFTDNVKGIYDYAYGQFSRYPSLVPPMVWENSKGPSAPSDLRRDDSETALSDGRKVTVLTWKHSTGDSTKVTFNVYSSRSWPVNTDDAANLIAVRLRQRRLLVPQDGSRHYAVTAMDRYGNESTALQDRCSGCEEQAGAHGGYSLLECDGRSLGLPEMGGTLDAPYLTIGTMQGRIITTRPWRGDRMDVSRLPEGMYVLRSLGKKGVNHRLGFFIVRRK